MLKQTIKSVFLKDPSKPWFWLLLGLLVKGLPILFLLHSRPPSDIPGIWGATMGDTHTYLDPVDNLFKTGNYYPDFRMPGYGFVYFLFRLFFSKVYACNMVIILQYLLAGISVYYLALIAQSVFNSNELFYICFYLFLISPYSNYYDGWLLTESLGCSSLIFAAWFFVKYFRTDKIRYLLFSGLLLTFSVFLRPVFAILLPVFLTIAFLKNRKISWLFVLPFLLCDGAWMTYNYMKHKKFIVLVQGTWVPKGDTTYIKPLYDFINSWGGSADYTDNHSYIYWFGFRFKDSPHPIDSLKFPLDIYTSQFNMDSLISLKKKIVAINDSVLLPPQTLSYQKEVRDKLIEYTRSVKSEHPLSYYIKAPFFHCLPRFLFGEESKIYIRRFNLPGRWHFLSIAFFTLFYYFVILAGSTGALFLLFKGLKGNKLMFLIAFIPLYIIIIHALILRLTFNRYLIPAYPFLILCSAYILEKLYARLFTKPLTSQS